jgi:hypothetical protein
MFMYAFLISPHEHFMPCPSHCPWFYYPTNVWWRIQIKLYILYYIYYYIILNYKLLWNFLQPLVTSSPISPNILLSTLFSVILHLCSCLNVKDQVSNTFKTTGKIIVFVALIFTYWGSRWKTKDSELHGRKHSLNVVSS